MDNIFTMITGAASGIGKGIAAKFASEGDNLFLLDLKEKELTNFQKELKELYPTINIQTAVGDITSPTFIDELVSRLEKKGEQIRVLVNNAGVFPSTPFFEISRQEWNGVLDLNVTSVFFLTQQIAKHMVSTNTIDASIVNISSTASENARPGVAHYCSSKAAIKMLTQVLALELAPYNIRINAVGPGLVETETLLNTLTNEKAIAEHEEKLSNSPMKRAADVSEIANAVYFIASPLASYISGQNLLVDGGYSAGRVFKSLEKTVEK